MTLKHKVNEALLRSLPYLSERRREVVVGFIMTNVFDNQKWFSDKKSWENNVAALLNTDVYLLIVHIKDALPYREINIESLHKSIDRYERRTHNTSP